MLNFSSNNPGIGTQNAAQNKSPEPIIQEVYEAEPDDYNYVPQISELDEADYQNMLTVQPEGVDTRVYKACAAFCVAAIIGAFIGYGVASVQADKADVQRKASIARAIDRTVGDKITALHSLKEEFDKIAEANYSEAAFESFKTKVRSPQITQFMLDMSSDITGEAVLLIDQKANPLVGLREYSAQSMLLRQLIETHLAETRADSDSILELQSHSGDETVLYAMQVIPDALYYLATTAPRSQYANGVVSIFTYRDVVEDDAELSSLYGDIKNDGQWSNEQRARRDYKPKDRKEEARLRNEGLDLPNHLIYDVANRQGNKSNLFADEVILVDRERFFGKSANAKARYEWRTQTIKDLIDKTVASSATIQQDLKAFIPDT